MVVMILTCIVGMATPWENTSIAALPALRAEDRTVPGALPAGVSLMYQSDAFKPGQGAFCITNTVNGPVSVPLFRVPLHNIDQVIVFYRAWARSTSTAQRAFLEIRCEYPGSKTRTSRLNESVLSETTAWVEVETPFYLIHKERPDAVVLGVAFEGPGTIWVGSGSLFYESRFWGRYGAGYGLSLGFLAILIGLWSAPVSYHSKRYGKRSRFVKITLIAWGTLVGMMVLLCLIANIMQAPIPMRIYSGVGIFLMLFMLKALRRQVAQNTIRIHPHENQRQNPGAS